MIDESYPERSFVVFFDCDGTLTIDDGSWPAVHTALGTTEFREAELKRYRAGKQTYEEWTTRTARKWEYCAVDAVETAFNAADLTENIRQTVQALQEMGAVVGVVSAGITQFVDLVGENGGVDFTIANTLGVDQGSFDGTVDIAVTDRSKSDVYETVVDDLQIAKTNVVMVGDARHDIQKLHADNLSIAYTPTDDRAAEAADVTIHDTDLTPVLQPVRRWVAQTVPAD